MQQKFSKIAVVTHLVKEEVVVEGITTQEPVGSETLALLALSVVQI
jgi:hypothetical protein